MIFWWFMLFLFVGFIMWCFLAASKIDEEEYKEEYKEEDKKE